MTSRSPDEFTRLLNLAAQGDPAAAQSILPSVIDELRRLARSKMRGLPEGQTLQPTALVNEVWVRLADSDPGGWEGRRHFYFVAARAMRDVLVEDARRKGASKRGGGQQRVELEDLHLVVDSPIDDVLELDRALTKLESVDEQGAAVVMLRFFVGLEVAETAEALGVSVTTVERKWRFVRAWLQKELGPDR